VSNDLDKLTAEDRESLEKNNNLINYSDLLSKNVEGQPFTTSTEEIYSYNDEMKK